MSANAPEIPEVERRGLDGKQADEVTVGGGLVFGHPLLGDDPMVTFDTTIVHVFHCDHSYNSSALEDAEKLKYDKYLDPYARVCSLAFVPLASTSICQLGADLLLVLWVCSILAVGRAKAEGADGKVPVAAHGPRPNVLASKTQRGLLFQAMKNRHRTYKAVVHRILGCYVGLRKDPKFLQALDVVLQPWADP